MWRPAALWLSGSWPGGGNKPAVPVGKSSRMGTKMRQKMAEGYVKKSAGLQFAQQDAHRR